MHATLLPVTTIVFVATFMACLAVANVLRRRETIGRNHIYKVAIDSLPESLTVKDKDGRYLIANPATARLMKAPNAEALIGKTDYDFLAHEIADCARSEEEKVLRSGVSGIVEQQLGGDDGPGGWLSTLKAPLMDEEGRITGLITHNRDVTPRKRLEAALWESELKATAALANMADGLIMFDPKLNVVFCNEQYRAMFPLTRDMRVAGFVGGLDPLCFDRKGRAGRHSDGECRRMGRRRHVAAAATRNGPVPAVRRAVDRVEEPARRLTEAVSWSAARISPRASRPNRRCAI